MAKVDIGLGNPYRAEALQEAVDDAAFWKYSSELPRTYLGISIIGHPCTRYLWLSFRWFGHELFSGRMYRLFRRGKREEETIVEDLRSAGVEIEHVLDDQLTFEFGCHVIGHPDGFIRSGVPEAPKKEHVAEFKTHSSESFRTLVKEGVRSAKPMHWAQMQCGMIGASVHYGHQVDRALYVAVNKDTDEYYMERVRLDEAEAREIIRRGQDIATDDYIPIRLSSKPDWWQCKSCFFYGFCHGTAGKRPLPAISCRTCTHFTAGKDGKCYCALFGNAEIPAEAQRKAQYCHVFHPNMVPDWAIADRLSTETSRAYSIPELGDDIILNGADGYSSREIIKAIEGGAENAAGIERISEENDTVSF